MERYSENRWFLLRLKLDYLEEWAIWVPVLCWGLVKSGPLTQYLLDLNLFRGFLIFLIWGMIFVGCYLSNRVLLCKIETGLNAGLHTQFFQSLIARPLVLQNFYCLSTVEGFSECFGPVKIGRVCWFGLDTIFSFETCL